MIIKKIKANFTILIVVFYAFTAVFLRYIYPQEPEIFPLFSWRLFAGVPNTRTEYSVEITKFGNTQLSQPVVFSEANFLASSKSVSARKLIQDFAQSYNKNQDYQKYQTVLETVYLDKTKEYRLVKQTYNPVDKFFKKKGEKETIATFQINDK